MKKRTTILLSCLAIALLSTAGLAETVVIDFDDHSGGMTPIPDGYAGFANWGSFAYSSTAQPPAYVPLSGTTYALSVGAAQPISFGEYYVFEGAWFIGYAPNAVAFELYADGDLVHTSETLEVSFDYQWLASGYDGLVNQVKIIYAFGANLWVMDDFTYQDNTVAAESTTWSTLKSLYR